jgi:hypothetical protein
VLRDVAKVDEGLRDLAKNGGAVEAASKLTSMTNALLGQKIPLANVKAAYTDTFAALDAAGFKIEKVKGGLINIVPPTEAAARPTGIWRLLRIWPRRRLRI